MKEPSFLEKRGSIAGDLNAEGITFLAGMLKKNPICGGVWHRADEKRRIADDEVETEITDRFE